MDIKKQQKFNERMTKRLMMSKGGYIRKLGDRVYFDNGGSTTIAGPTTVGNASPTQTAAKIGSVNIGNDPNALQNQANPVNYLGAGINSIIDATQNHFQATGAPVQAGTNAAQLNNAYTTAQGGLNAQANLVNQLQGQNGINNQNQVYGQTQGIINGTGPNPALATLNQQTGQNVANQAALAANQRGASNNVGLMNRQAAQTGAAAQQQAIGQAATTQANQQLGAIAQAGNIAQNQVNSLGQAVTGLNTAGQNEQNILQNANNAYNTNNVAMQSNLNNVNGQISQGNQSAFNGLLGGAMSGVSSVLSALAHGGEVKRMDDGGEVTANLGSGAYTAIAPEAAPSIGSMGTSPDEGAAFKSSSGGSGGGGGGIASLAALAATGGAMYPGPHKSHVANFLAAGGAAKKVPAMLSTGERYLNRQEVEQVQHGADPLKLGTKVPGKAKVKGDSLKNDIVPADLEEGGVVIPRHIMNKKDSDKAAMFVIKSMKATGKHIKRPAGMK